MTQGGKRFTLGKAFDEGDLVGARWWNESLIVVEAAGDAGRSDRRSVVKFLLASGALVVMARTGCTDDDDAAAPDLSMDSLDVQRERGWNVGERPGSLLWTDGVSFDAARGLDWDKRLAELMPALAPAEAAWQPFQIPTLFQAPAHASGRSLRGDLRPVHSTAMEVAFARGKALRSLLTSDGLPPADLAIVADLPGPESVAFAAGCAPAFTPVFTFDNWPHPEGVVPSHLTLGACLYHLPSFERAARERQSAAPAIFVLDANRLRPYVDDSDQFDNRYIAKLPSAAAFRERGVTRVLYVRPSATQLQELDDLNDDFVQLAASGVDIKPIALTDFAPEPAADSSTYHYGGVARGYVYFWPRYGWTGPRVSVPARVAPPQIPLSPAPAYRPSPRPTIFATHTRGGGTGIGKQKPSGFGRVSVQRSSRGSGYTRRSGSFGRSRSSSFG